jgi:hypothetical protein
MILSISSPLPLSTPNFQNLHCSHQYSTNTSFIIICMPTAISPCQHCLITSTWGKKFCYCLHNRDNMTLNLKPGAYRSMMEGQMSHLCANTHSCPTSRRYLQIWIWESI